MAPCLCNCVFDSLHWASPDDLPSWLCLEYCGFLCKRIDACPRFCGGFLDDNEFGESGHKEGSRLLEFFVAYAAKRLDDALDILPCKAVGMLVSYLIQLSKRNIDEALLKPVAHLSAGIHCNPKYYLVGHHHCDS
jgi:hypothetical protein